MISFDQEYTFVDFSLDVKFDNRFFLGKDASNFLDAIINTCGNRVIDLKEGTILWRAQLGYDEKSFSIPNEPHPPERMKPISGKCFEGRCNPKGIPYLYLAEKKETAMAEVRPSRSEMLSLGAFKINSDLMLIDTKIETAHQPYVEDIDIPQSQRDLEFQNWFLMDYYFSKPTNRSDTEGDYAPTQIISERLKLEGYDGIRYRSSLNAGNNVVLFDLITADQVDSHVYSCSAIKYCFKNETPRSE